MGRRESESKKREKSKLSIDSSILKFQIRLPFQESKKTRSKNKEKKRRNWGMKVNNEISKRIRGEEHGVNTMDIISEIQES